MIQPFSGQIVLDEDRNNIFAVANDDRIYQSLYGHAYENGATLTLWAYLKALGTTGTYIVMFCVLLFGISTAISWSYYGARCVMYLFGQQYLLSYRIAYVIIHLIGANLSLQFVWDIGDIAMSLATIPNVIALVFLSGVVRQLTLKYFKNVQ